ncbi:MAG: ABC transporter ATP-binding protein, partial [Gaiellaceae bacterium]
MTVEAAESPSATAAAEYDIRLIGLTKQFDDVVAVDGISLDIDRGQFFALLGPSGCGKTTTLRMIGGFEEPTEGRIELGGVDVAPLPPYKRDVNTVFQSYALFPHLTIFENVAFGLRRRGVKGGDLRGRVGDALGLVGLAGLERRKPRQLSGGQQQRIALARALVNRPRVLLLDEPLGALDLKLRKEMQLELKRIQNEVGITFVHVTHDQEEAMVTADRIAVMREGQIVQIGRPAEVYETPNSRYVADFIGDVNLFEGYVTSADGARVTLSTPDCPAGLEALEDDALSVGSHAWLGVRPEKIVVHLDPPMD